MLLTRLRVQNFGPLRGNRHLELRPLDRNRPIILIGGKNGVGKTSTLEAIRLCLFGRRALGSRPSDREYQDYLLDKIHRPPSDSPALRRASVGLEFEHGHAGRRTVYSVERSWERRGQRPHENLFVMRDGQPLQGADRAGWQEFVETLIPPALAELFFFDGERIQTLAEDAEDAEFASAVRTLLGLDLVQQLRADLGVYVARETRGRDGQLDDRLTALDDEAEERQRRRARLTQDAGGLQGHLDQQRSALAKLEERVAREGGASEEHRKELEADRDALDASRRAAGAQLHDLAAGLLPFTLAPALVERALSALAREEAQRELTTARTARMRVLDRVGSALRNEAFWTTDGPTDIEQRTTLATRLLALVDDALELRATASDTTPAHVVHGLSEADTAWVVAHFRRALTEAGPAAQQLGEQILELDQRRSRVEAHLERAPTQDALERLRPLLDELQNLHRAVAATEQQLKQADKELHELKLADDAGKREQDRLAHDLVRQDQAESRSQLATRVREVLSDFNAALNHARLAELERTVEHCFHRLARKDDLVGRIAIDRQTLRVSLYDRDGRPVSKTALSAGEKQIYAVALLWALAQVSGRKLPVIVDTPLGRLDSDHRANLARAYFPHAAEQVVILSTDTEIDQAYAQRLAPAISRAYRIEYDPAERASLMLPGYFWDDLGADPSAAPSELADEYTSEVYDEEDEEDGAFEHEPAQLAGAGSTTTLEPARAGA